VVREIIDTERSYVQSCETLVDVYINPLRQLASFIVTGGGEREKAARYPNLILMPLTNY